MWQPGWEGSLGVNGRVCVCVCVCVCSGVPLLFTWNYHNIVDCTPIKHKKFPKKISLVMLTKAISVEERKQGLEKRLEYEVD